MAVGHRVAAAMVCALCAVGLAAFAETWPVERSSFSVVLGCRTDDGGSTYKDYNHLYLLMKSDFDDWKANSGTRADLEKASLVAAVCVDQSHDEYKYNGADMLWGTVTSGTFPKLPPMSDDDKYYKCYHSYNKPQFHK